jgi:hypothetical protein
MNPYLLGAAIYLVLFVVALLFMFALGRVAAKADRDAERLGLSEPDDSSPTGPEMLSGSESSTVGCPSGRRELVANQSGDSPSPREFESHPDRLEAGTICGEAERSAAESDGLAPVRPPHSRLRPSRPGG